MTANPHRPFATSAVARELAVRTAFDPALAHQQLVVAGELPQNRLDHGHGGLGFGVDHQEIVGLQTILEHIDERSPRLPAPVAPKLVQERALGHRIDPGSSLGLDITAASDGEAARLHPQVHQELLVSILTFLWPEHVHRQGPQDRPQEFDQAGP